MISTSYDLDDSNQRNSSASIIDEESIFLSSSSDEDLPLSSRFNVGNTNSLKKKQNNVNNKHKYMETMINDGLEADSNDSNISEEATDQVSDDEVKYIPMTSYSEEADDDIDEVSDEDEESEKPTSIYDEYDPENLDHFTTKQLLKNAHPKYEPTPLNQSSESDDDYDKQEESKKSKPVRKVHQTRSTGIPAEPDIKSKRKYVRKTDETVNEEVSTVFPAKRPYNNSNRTRNSEKKNKLNSGAVNNVDQELKKAKITSNDPGMSQGSLGDSSEEESLESKESEEGKDSKNKKLTKQATITVFDKKKTPSSSGIPAGQLDPKKLKTKPSEAPVTMISGRIINLSSGFKIPKRPSNETTPEKNSSSVPPEKKPRTVTKEATLSSKPSGTNQQKNTKPVLDKSSVKSSSLSSSSSSKLTSNKDSSKTPTSVVSNNQIKVAKPKKAELKESDLFMDALGPSTHSTRPKAKPVAKSQLSTATSKKSTESEYSITSSTSATFSNLTNSNSSSHLTLNQSNLANLNTRASNQLNIDSGNSPNGDHKSNLTEPGFKKPNKRKVVWADHHSKQLENISYYELDETEREIKKNAFKGGDMAKIEKLNEKEMKFKHQDSSDIDPLTDQLNEAPWPILIPIDLPESTHQPTISSAEHEIQVARERNILGVLMFKEFLPDSPSEPTDSAADHNREIVSTKLIPLDDIVLNQSASEIEINHIPEEVISSKPINDIMSSEMNQISNNYSPTDQFNFNSQTGQNRNNTSNYYHHNIGKNHHGHYNNQQNNLYNKSHHQQHYRQEEQSVHKESLRHPSKLFTSNSPPRSAATVGPTTTKPTATVMPLSPTTTMPRLYSKLVEDSPDIKKQPDIIAPASDASNLLSLSSSLLSSNEMTEKIKQILNQINCTSSTSKLEEPREPITTEPTKLMSLTEIELPPAFTATVARPTTNSDADDFNDYNKGGKWSTPSSNYHSNKSYGSNNNSYNNNTASQKPNGDFNQNRNNGNNRNQFPNNNNFRRGIGQRNNLDSHSNFSQRNSSNNNNNNSYQNNKLNNNRGGGNGRYNNGNKNYQSRLENPNQKNDSRFNQNNERSGGFFRNFNKDLNYENDSPPKNTSNTNRNNSTNATAMNTVGKGAWI